MDLQMNDEGRSVTVMKSDVLKKKGEDKYIVFGKPKGNGARIPVEALLV